MNLKSITLKNAYNEDINLDLRYSEGTRDAAAVLIVHGFKGFKDWGFFPDIAARLAHSGYITITFNFSRNGIGLDPHKFTQLDRFAENSYSHELSDLETILKAIKTQQLGNRLIDPERIGLLGHSRGGASALLFAIEHEDEIMALITWASIANLYRYSEDQIARWENHGYIEIENVRTKQMMRINKTFWDDLNKNRERFDLLNRIADIDIPALFIHGHEDNSVPCSESEQLADACGSYSKRLELIDGADHTFGIKHPFENPTPLYETICDLSENWFDTHLNL